MKFDFPKSQTKRTIWLKLNDEIWYEIEKMKLRYKLSDEVLFSTIIHQAWYRDEDLYACSREICKNHEDGIFTLDQLWTGDNGKVYCSLECLQEETDIPIYNIKPTLPKNNYSVKRDYVEAGDNRRMEIVEKYPDSFDGGGDLRTKEAKKKNSDAVALGKLGGLVGGNARAKALSPERRKEISKKALEARWNKDKKSENKVWSTFYSECIQCHSNENEHVELGYCSKCYPQQQEKEREKTKKNNIDENKNIEEPEMIDNGEKDEVPIVDDKHSFCQYKYCTKSGAPFVIVKMFKDGEFLFCSKDCLMNYRVFIKNAMVDLTSQKEIIE